MKFITNKCLETLIEYKYTNVILQFTELCRKDFWPRCSGLGEEKSSIICMKQFCKQGHLIECIVQPHQHTLLNILYHNKLMVEVCALQSALKNLTWKRNSCILVVIIYGKFHKKSIHNFLSYPDYNTWRQTHTWRLKYDHTSTSIGGGNKIRPVCIGYLYCEKLHNKLLMRSFNACGYVLICLWISVLSASPGLLQHSGRGWGM